MYCLVCEDYSVHRVTSKIKDKCPVTQENRYWFRYVCVKCGALTWLKSHHQQKGGKVCEELK